MSRSYVPSARENPRFSNRVKPRIATKRRTRRPWPVSKLENSFRWVEEEDRSRGDVSRYRDRRGGRTHFYPPKSAIRLAVFQRFRRSRCRPSFEPRIHVNKFLASSRASYCLGGRYHDIRITVKAVCRKRYSYLRENRFRDVSLDDKISDTISSQKFRWLAARTFLDEDGIYYAREKKRRKRRRRKIPFRRTEKFSRSRPSQTGVISMFVVFMDYVESKNGIW